MNKLDFKLQEGESQNHFIWRVYKFGYKTGQLTKEEAGDICSEELSLQFDESAYRKRYEAFDKMWQEVKEEYLIDSDEELMERLSKIEDKEDELYKTKVKTADKLREWRASLRHNARFENIIDVAESIGKSMQESHPFEFSVKEYKPSENKVAILTISDLHYGMEYENFISKFNVQILKERIQQVIDETIYMCELNGYTDLKILNLGDCINGLIHLGTRVESEEDAISQIMEVSELIASMINQLAPYFNTIEYDDTLDNHSRITPDKKVALHVENLSRIISFYLKPRLANLNNVKITSERIDDTITLIDILGEPAFAVHGHMDRLNNAVSKLTMFMKIFPIAVFMGHYHHSIIEDKDGIEMIVNGAFSGVDTHAKEFRLSSQAKQHLHFYEKRRGRVLRVGQHNIIF